MVRLTHNDRYSALCFVVVKMKVKTVKSEGISHNSYFVSDDGDAVVIDPRRDCEIYAQAAKEECTRIKYILETHRNEDYVIGSLELQNTIDAEIGHGKMLPFKYGEHNLTEGDVFEVGGLKIKTLYTPGHTNESLCYVVYDDTEPVLVFTGDTLFAGAVGRTDLYGKPKQETQAERLFNSLHEKILPLGDHVLVYPGHGSGSVCGHGISGSEPTTLGYEKKTNPYLELNKEDFIKKVSSEELVVPNYFRKMEEYNLNGPPLLSELSNPKHMSLSKFEDHLANPNILVVDTRLPYGYAGSHIPSSISMWLGGTSVYPGWILDFNQHVVFIHERPADIDVATTRFRRLGFDNICGYLCGGMNQWQESGKPIRSLKTISAADTLNKLKREEVVLLDVRDPSELIEDGYVEGALRIFFAELSKKTPDVPRDKPVVVTCSVGNRSSIACSILERAGFSDISNMLGGMTAWTKLGYSTQKGS